MSSKGVNRVVIAVRDLDKAVELYSSMLGVSFEDASWTGSQFGITVAISWQAGVELCAPIAGQESVVSQFLDENGEGVMGVVFATDDLEDAKAKAEAAGVAALIPINFSQEEIDEHLGGHFKTYKEYVLNSFDSCGFGIMLAQIDPK